MEAYVNMKWPEGDENPPLRFLVWQAVVEVDNKNVPIAISK